MLWEGTHPSRALPGRGDTDVLVCWWVRWLSLAEPRFTTGSCSCEPPARPFRAGWLNGIGLTKLSNGTVGSEPPVGAAFLRR